MSTIFHNNMSWNNQQSRKYPKIFVLFLRTFPLYCCFLLLKPRLNIRTHLIYWKLTPPIRNLKDIFNDRLLFKKMDYIKHNAWKPILIISYFKTLWWSLCRLLLTRSLSLHVQRFSVLYLVSLFVSWFLACIQ